MNLSIFIYSAVSEADEKSSAVKQELSRYTYDFALLLSDYILIPLEDWWTHKRGYLLKKQASSSKRKTPSTQFPACKEIWIGQLDALIL